MTVQGGFRGYRPTPLTGQDAINPSQRPSFWESTSLEDLIRAQGVGVADNLDEISMLWPVGDDPDELLRFISEERESRRGNAG